VLLQRGGCYFSWKVGSGAARGAAGAQPGAVVAVLWLVDVSSYSKWCRTSARTSGVKSLQVRSL